MIEFMKSIVPEGIPEFDIKKLSDKKALASRGNLTIILTAETNQEQ